MGGTLSGVFSQKAAPGCVEKPAFAGKYHQTTIKDKFHNPKNQLIILKFLDIESIGVFGTSGTLSGVFSFMATDGPEAGRPSRTRVFYMAVAHAYI